MAHMTLPPEHSEADALLAERIGRALDLEEVHVFWTLPGVKPAADGPSDHDPTPLIAGVVVGLTRLVERIVSPLRPRPQRR
jgi:hypothetical protein